MSNEENENKKENLLDIEAVIKGIAASENGDNFGESVQQLKQYIDARPSHELDASKLAAELDNKIDSSTNSETRGGKSK